MDPKTKNNNILQKLQNLKVDEFTTPCLKSVSPETSLTELERLMKEENIRHIPVKKEGQVLGIISERDVYFSYRLGDADSIKAQDIMQKNPYQVDSRTKISEVAFYMSENKFGSALVTGADGELGIFTSTDALNALIEVLRGDILDQ